MGGLWNKDLNTADHAIIGGIAGEVGGAGLGLLAANFLACKGYHDRSHLRRKLMPVSALAGLAVGSGVGAAYGAIKNHEPSFHAVKKAGVVNSVANAGKFLFDAHPLPTYRSSHPGQKTPNWFDKINPLGTDKGVQPGYTPGRLGRLFGAQEIGPHSLIGQMTPGYGEGLLNKAKSVGHSVGELGREAIFGSPLALDRQLRAPNAGGIARNYLNLSKDFYFPRGRSVGETALGLGMGLAMPAASLYNAATGDPNRRGENIGAAIGGIAAAPITTRLGIPGMLLQQPVQQLGAWVGSKFDPSPKVASLTGAVVDAAKKHPVSAALTVAATLEGAKKLVKKTDPTIPPRST